MLIAPAFAQPDELLAAVRGVRDNLKPQLSDITYTLDRDWAGDPAIFFEVVVPDALAERDPMLRKSRHLRFDIQDALQPVEKWGVMPYFRFLTESESVPQLAFRG